MEVRTVLGIDPGVSPGLVVLNPRAQVLEAYQPVFKGTGLERAEAIATHIVDLCSKHDVGRVCVEGYAISQAFSMVCCVEIGSLIRYLLRLEGIPYTEVGPTQLKKFVKGGKKDDMKLAVYKLYGFEDRSHDVVDAYALAQIGLALQGSLDQLPSFQREVVEKLQNG